MSKKNDSGPKLNLVQLLAFIAIVLSAALIIINYFEPIPILSFIAQICSYLVLGLEGFYFIRKRAVGYKVVYFVSIILLIVFFVLGFKF